MLTVLYFDIDQHSLAGLHRLVQRWHVDGQVSLPRLTNDQTIANRIVMYYESVVSGAANVQLNPVDADSPRGKKCRNGILTIGFPKSAMSKDLCHDSSVSENNST
jgi:hypothetical protein